MTNEEIVSQLEAIKQVVEALIYRLEAIEEMLQQQQQEVPTKMTFDDYDDTH